LSLELIFCKIFEINNSYINEFFVLIKQNSAPYTDWRQQRHLPLLVLGIAPYQILPAYFLMNVLISEIQLLKSPRNSKSNNLLLESSDLNFSLPFEALVEVQKVHDRCDSEHRRYDNYDEYL